MKTFGQEFLAVWLITLGLGQLASTYWGWRGLSLVGASRMAGVGVSVSLLALGAFLLPNSWVVLWWALPAGLLTVTFLVIGGSFIAPPPHPDQLFAPGHSAHADCCVAQIPDGDERVPALLLRPPQFSPDLAGERPAVCIVPGAGDTKTWFKWRLVEALLAETLTVLTIDPPGHGDYRHRPMTYPDALSVVPAAIAYLKRQPYVTKVGVIGISLGGALAINSLAEMEEDLPSALVIIATPTALNYSNALFYREMWRTFYGSPSLSLFKEMSARQARQIWESGGYRSQHNTAELIELLNPLENIKKLKGIPILLTYGRRDRVAPPDMAQAMRQAAPEAAFIESKKASHVMLTLIPEINRQMARWLKEQLR